MKKIRLINKSHTLCTLFILFAFLLAIVSCNNLTQEKTKSEAKEKPVLRIKISEPARTVFPFFNLADLSDFTLKGTKEGGTEKNFNDTPYETVSDLQKANFTLNSDDIGKNWTFTLSAKKGTVELSSTVAVTLCAGENYVTFRLAPLELGSGNGTFALTLDYSADTVNAGRVTNGSLVIETLDTSPVQVASISSFVPSANILTVNADNIPAGTYRAIIRLYGGLSGDIFMAEWREIIRIATGFTSSATRTLTSLNDIYSITYVFNDESTADRTESVTPSSSLLVPEHTDWIFIDWFKDSALTQPFVISEITEDTTIYAKWIDSSNPHIATKATVAEKIAAVDAADTRISDPYEIKVLGGVENTTFDKIKAALQNNSSAFIALDFSGATGITTLPQNCFSSTNIVKVTLPDSLETIEWGVFENCHSLTGITIPASVNSVSVAFVNTTSLASFTVADGNQYYKSVDGVLYSKDGTVLVSYPSGKVAASYTTPSEVTRIAMYAFSHNQKTPVINISQNVNVIEGYAFWYCRDIDSINLADTQSVWYSSSSSTPEEAFQNGEPYYSLLYITEEWKNGNYYFTNKLYKKSGETFADHVTDVTGAVIAPAESRDLTNSNSYYNVVSLGGNKKYKWLKLSTVAGKLYKILCCDYYTYSNFTIGEFTVDDFYDCCMDIYDDVGSKIYFDSVDEDSDGNCEVFTFVAKSSTTYIRLSNSPNDKYLALQISTPSMNAAPINVTVLNKDLEIERTEDDDCIRFEIKGSFNSSYYYVDDLSISYTDWSYCYLYPSNYSKDLHIFTIEVYSNGKYYSYSEQFYGTKEAE